MSLTRDEPKLFRADMKSDKKVATIRVIMMPRDTNALGTIFGGVILSYIDQAASIEALRQANRRVVTKAMNAVEFVAPVQLGDVVSFYSHTLRVGRTSITVRVEVEAERFHERLGQQRVRVTEAEVVCVAVNDQGRPAPVRPPLKGIRTH